MSNNLIQKLANKFLEHHFDNDKMEKQKEMFEIFYYDKVGELKSIINEMSGDLLLIKEKHLHLDIRQLFGKVYQQIIDLYKEIDPQDPYPGTLNLINWANSKTNKSILENLDFLIQKHLEKNETLLYGAKKLKQPQVVSINHFLTLIPALKQFILDNPSLEIIHQNELSKMVEDQEPPSGPDESTNVI